MAVLNYVVIGTEFTEDEIPVQVGGGISVTGFSDIEEAKSFIDSVKCGAEATDYVLDTKNMAGIAVGTYPLITVYIIWGMYLRAFIIGMKLI